MIYILDISQVAQLKGHLQKLICNIPPSWLAVSDCNDKQKKKNLIKKECISNVIGFYFKKCHNELSNYYTFSCIQQDTKQEQCVAFQEGQVKTICALQTTL